MYSQKIECANKGPAAIAELYADLLPSTTGAGLTPAEMNLDISIEPEDFASTYTPIKHLGEGGYGTVWLVEHIQNKSLHAAKMVKDKRMRRKTWCEERQMMMPDEIMLWELLSHPNLLNLQEIFYEEDTWIIIMEYHPHFVDLFNYVCKHGAVSADLARYIISQVMDIIYYLLSLNIDHRDIKDENILLDPTTGQIKMIDFGSASLINPDTVYTRFQGTEVYLPPEYHNNGKYSAVGGMTWAVGCLAFVLLNGDCPFQSPEDVKTYKTPKYLKQNIDRASKSFIEDLMTANEDRRYDIIDVIEHPWMTA